MARLLLRDPVVRWTGAGFATDGVVAAMMCDFDQFTASNIKLTVFGIYRHLNPGETSTLECRIGGDVGASMLDTDGDVAWSATSVAGDTNHSFTGNATITRPTGRQKVVFDFTGANTRNCDWAVLIEDA